MNGKGTPMAAAGKAEYFQRELSFEEKFFHPGPAGKSLEAGCGNGVFQQRLGLDSYGLDLDLGYLQANPCRHLVCAYMERMPFKDACFDHAYAITSLQYTDFGKAFAELLRVTRKGGRIGFTLPNAFSLAGLHRALLLLLNHYRFQGKPLPRPKMEATPWLTARVLGDARVKAVKASGSEVAFYPWGKGHWPWLEARLPCFLKVLFGREVFYLLEKR